MSTTDIAAALTTIYTAILQVAELTPAFAVKVVARVAERVELMYDDMERDEFVTRVAQLQEDHGYAVDVAATMAARELVDDGLLELANGRGGGWAALYDPALDVEEMPEVDGDWGDYERRESVRGQDSVHADYFPGRARELVESDGLRLPALTFGDHVAEGDLLDGALVAARVVRDDTFELVTVTVIPRSSMVHEAMGNLSPGVVEGEATLVLNYTDPVLIRY